jgi:hypothetical protein
VICRHLVEVGLEDARIWVLGRHGRYSQAARRGAARRPR